MDRGKFLVTMKPLNIADNFVALDNTNGARSLNVDSNFWESLEKGELGDFSRLISFFCFDEDWKTWEKHPNGEEFVFLLEGDITLILETNGDKREVVMNDTFSFVIVPKDTWHTANVSKSAKMLFVTPGEGTEIRAR